MIDAAHAKPSAKRGPYKKAVVRDCETVAVSVGEVAPGLVTYRDPAELVKFEGCLTNVLDLGRIPDRPGPFLVLGADAELEGFLCAPLYTGKGLDGIRTELEESEKIGAGLGWTGRASYWHSKYFWITPAACFSSASSMEMNPIQNRKRYNISKFAAIIAHRDDSEADFGPPNSN